MTNQKVYFMQHGIAVDKAKDPERPLSETGIQQTKKMAEALYNAKVPITSIFHSGKLRSLQTARIIAETIDLVTENLKQHSHLSPNDDIQLLLPQLQHNALYVGHLPHLDKLCNYLLTGNNDTGMILFRNSAVICLALCEDMCQLNWYLTPEIIIS